MANHDPISRRRWIQLAGVCGGASILSTPRFLIAQDAVTETEATSSASSIEEPNSSPPEPVQRLAYDLPKTENWRIGLILTTPVALANVFATFPVPRDWPEQKVTLIGQTIDPLVSHWEMREVAEGAKQVAVAMNQVPARSTVEMTLQFQIERTRIVPASEMDDLVPPKRNERELRPYLGNSPHIDASNARIKKVSRELAVDQPDVAWKRVERIYDWVRENVKYMAGDLKNASAALKDGTGDCEEMTSLIVALCRNAQIPARMVWVHEHCYPEFYLEDAQGNGTWFPCQAAGTRQFGQMEEYRPIMQKGDRFKVKETTTPVRYVAEFFKCDRKGKGTPKPKFIREPMDAPVRSDGGQS